MALGFKFRWLETTTALISITLLFTSLPIRRQAQRYYFIESSLGLGNRRLQTTIDCRTNIKNNNTRLNDTTVVDVDEMPMLVNVCKINNYTGLRSIERFQDQGGHASDFGQTKAIDRKPDRFVDGRCRREEMKRVMAQPVPAEL